MRNAPLVQLVERWSPKPNVVGSSPTGREFLYRFRQAETSVG